MGVLMSIRVINFISWRNKSLHDTITRSNSDKLLGIEIVSSFFVFYYQLDFSTYSYQSYIIFSSLLELAIQKVKKIKYDKNVKIL